MTLLMKAVSYIFFFCSAQTIMDSRNGWGDANNTKVMGLIPICATHFSTGLDDPCNSEYSVISDSVTNKCYRRPSYPHLRLERQASAQLKATAKVISKGKSTHHVDL